MYAPLVTFVSRGRGYFFFFSVFISCLVQWLLIDDRGLLGAVVTQGLEDVSILGSLYLVTWFKYLGGGGGRLRCLILGSRHFVALLKKTQVSNTLFT